MRVSLAGFLFFDPRRAFQDLGKAVQAVARLRSEDNFGELDKEYASIVRKSRISACHLYMKIVE